MSTSGLAIDSGVNPACAYFARGELVHACFWQWPTGAGLDWIVVEQWQFRGAVDVPRVPKLIKMMTGGLLAAGHAAGHGGAPVTLWTPEQWKGQEPKPVMHSRAWAVFTPAERVVLGGDATRAEITAAVEKGALRRWAISGADCYAAKSVTHNLLDATCMGLVKLKRMEKR